LQDERHPSIMKTVYSIVLAILVILTGLYLYVRYSALKTKDFKPDTKKEKSVTDLRPAIIAKLQQMVKDGSDGLYYLSIGKIEPDVLKSTVELSDVTITPDQAAIKKLDSNKTLPDDVFKITFSALHVTGIDIRDILSKDHLSLNDISISNPVIEVYHKKRSYNQPTRIKNDSATLYQRLMNKMKSISIQKIDISNGTLINHNVAKNHTNTLNDVSIKMYEVLVDSSTQFDQKRFLFAKKARLSTTNLTRRTTDSLYLFKCGSIQLSTPGNDITALNVEFHPTGNKQQFESRLSTRKEMVDMTIPKVTLSGIDWWGLANNESIIADEAVINNSSFKVFLDRSLPFRKVKLNSFPHQVLMRIPIPVSISKIYFQHANYSYTEYNPGLDKTGSVYFDDLKGEGTNVTNIAERIKRHQFFTIRFSGLFMHKIPMSTGFEFNLAKYKTGDFKMDFEINEMDTALLNPFVEPLGEFMIKKGILQKGIAHITGDNFKTNGSGELLYKGLYVVGLKKNDNKPDHIKKKSVMSFLGNVLLIKNDNPAKGEPPRIVTLGLQRDYKTTFMSFVWKTMLLGILKTVGLPSSMANKPY
jgi:hypothetical protein